MKQLDLAAALGVRQSMISMAERGQRSLHLGRAVKAAQVLEVSLDFLGGLTENPAPAADASQPRRVGRYQMIPRFAAGPSDAPGSFACHIGRWDLSAAAGAGAAFDEALRVGYESFDAEWCLRRGVQSQHCAVLDVRGDSMEPTLPDGCLILVDRSRQVRRNDSLFVVGTEDGLVVKRLVKSGHGWLLVSDNPEWEPAVWPESARVLGQVRWASREFD